MRLTKRSWTDTLTALGLIRRHKRFPVTPLRPRRLRTEQLEAKIVLDGTSPFDSPFDDPAYETPEGEDDPDLVAFAKALDAAGVKYYGAAWCIACTQQKELFEDGGHHLPFFEVTDSERQRNALGDEKGITAYPTWVFNEGEANEDRHEGTLTLAEISQRSGVAIPTGNDPIFETIDDQTLLDGSPLHIPLDGYDPNGGTLTYTVEVGDDSKIAEATILSGNRSMEIYIGNSASGSVYGSMVYQLFEGRASRATNQIIALAEDGFYDGVSYHRIIDDFMIQGGDPDGDGTGGSSLPDFDDHFHFDLQHNRQGVLSMAKGDDDSNNSQFFTTDRDTRSLDFNHSVLGQLVEGFPQLDAISSTKVNDNGFGEISDPQFDIIMDHVTIFDDVENGLLFLKAVPGATGSTTVTVTVTDGDQNEYEQTFNVTISPDAYNGGPFLSDIPDDIRMQMGTTDTIQLEANDVEGNDVYFDQAISDDYAINNDTGLITVTPPTDFVGPLEVFIGVRSADGEPNDTGDTWDTQVFNVTVAPDAPTGVDLLAVSDSGQSDSDDVTGDATLDFQISGVTAGATVTLYAGDTEIGTGTATDTTIVISTANLGTLGDGSHEITATQTLDNTDDDDTTESDRSTALTVTYDTTAPPEFTSTPPALVIVGQQYGYDPENPEESSPGVFYSLDDGTTSATIDVSTGQVDWIPASSEVGDHQFDIVAADLAGNERRQMVDVTVLGELPAVADAYATDEDTTLTVDAAGGVLDNDGDASPDPLSAQLVTQPANGQVTLNSDGSFTYEPDDDFHGDDTFTYRAVDSVRASTDTTVTITVDPVNDAPAAEADSYVVEVNGTLDIDAAAGVLTNDVDVDSASLTAELLSGPDSGTLQFDDDGSFTYTPDTDFTGQVSFTYRALDGDLLPSEQTTVTIDVNDSPVAGDDGPYAVDEDTTLTVDAANGVLDNDTDTEDDPITAVLLTQPANGSVTLDADGSFVYTPDADFFGSDTFTYAANDGLSDSAAATVTIDVAGTQDPPTGVPDSYNVDEEGTLTVNVADGVLDNDTDIDGDTALTASIESQPANGTVTLEDDGSFVYTPDDDFFGTDTFTYRVNDGQADSEPTEVSIAVANTQDAPVAADDTYTIAEDNTLTVDVAGGVTANDVDVDQDTLTVTPGTPPAHGNLTLNQDGSFTYVPTANFHGVDTFTYVANDGTENSNEATVTITVTSVNDAPVAVADNYSVDEDATLAVTVSAAVTVNDTDVEDDDLTPVLVTGPSNGQLDLDDDGTFTYTPDDDFNGTDTFTYRVDDGTEESNNATVTITVNAVNDPPNTVNDDFTVTENSEDNPLDPLANDNSDPDGAETLTIAALGTGTQGGTLTIVNDGGGLEYTPPADFVGIETFTYTVSDGNGGEDQGTIEIAVEEAASSLSGHVFVDTNDNGAFDDGEIPLPGVTVTLTGEVDGESVEQTAQTNEDGVYSFTELVNGTYELVESHPAAMIDGKDALGTAGGELANDRFFDITLSGDEEGVDYDFGEMGLRAELVSIRLFLASTGSPSDWLSDLMEMGETLYGDNPPIVVDNTAPVASADSFGTDEGQALTVAAGDGVLSNDTDADGDSLTAELVDDAANGSLTLSADGSFDYTPDQNFQGTDTFTYRADDGTAVSDTVTVTIAVSSDNDAPVAQDDDYTVDEDNELVVQPDDGVLDNDSDDDEDPLTVSLVRDALHGDLTLNADGSFEYEPNNNFNGIDTFTYTANDGEADSDIATVTITVHSINDAPLVNDDGYDASENQTLAVDAAAGVLNNDIDVDGDTLTVQLVDQPTNGSLSVNDNGSFTYTPNTDFTGLDTFTYQVTDGQVTSATTATVTIDVGGVNEAPVANGDAYDVDEDTPLTVDAAAGVLDNDTDAESDTLSAVLVTAPSHAASFTLNANGSFSYTPNANFNGSDSFTYKANDGLADSNSVTVTITVNPINDAPTGEADTYSATSGVALTVDAAGGVLANDSDPEGSALSATIADQPNNGTLTFNADGSFTYTANAGFAGVDTFSYQASDGELSSNTTTVTLNVVDSVADLVEFRLKITDTEGENIDSVEQGQQFIVEVSVKDLRAEPEGVFSAYLDVNYDSALVTANSIEHDTAFFQVQSGTVDLEDIVDEVGGTSPSSIPTGGGSLRVVRITMTADSVGTAVFTSDPADQIPAHEVTLFGSDDVVPNNAIVFDSASIDVVSGGAEADGQPEGEPEAGSVQLVLPVFGEPLAAPQPVSVDLLLAESTPQPAGTTEVTPVGRIESLLDYLSRTRNAGSMPSIASIDEVMIEDDFAATAAL